jgi:hypothetical protein
MSGFHDRVPPGGLNSDYNRGQLSGLPGPESTEHQA